jgi:class 3 adenylate cyclase
MLRVIWFKKIVYRHKSARKLLFCTKSFPKKRVPLLFWSVSGLFPNLVEKSANKHLPQAFPDCKNCLYHCILNYDTRCMKINRLPVFVLLLFTTGFVPAQSVADLETRLKNATTAEEKWNLCFQLGENLLSVDPGKAAAYAGQAAQLAIGMSDKRREARAAFLSGDAAFRNKDLKTAAIRYAQAWEASRIDSLHETTLQSIQKLGEITVQQQNFREASRWSREETNFFKEKARREYELRNRKQKEAKAELERRKKIEKRNLSGLAVGFGVLWGFLFYRHRRAKRRIAGELSQKNAMIEEKRRRSDQLLLNILPQAVAAELAVRNRVAARRYEKATVMFVDFAGFTQVAELLSPEVLVAELDYCFSGFDNILGRQRIEKIKTAGDAYICASGLSDHNESPADMIRAAIRFQEFMYKFVEERQRAGRPYFKARIGIHFGPVVAGVVGAKKFAYDIWGDTVNIAARMEETCEPGRINVSRAAYEVVQDVFTWEYRGKVAAKNKGEVEMYYAAK